MLPPSNVAMPRSQSPKLSLHPDGRLLCATPEPTAAACPQRRGLFNLTHAGDLAVKLAGRGFAAFRSRNLNMIDS
jgi:hypothetical protein